MSNVVLTGFMGTGKSTVGRLIAERLGFDFVDTDAEIEARHGSIATIFDEQGEDAFRDMERELALELADRQELVISTGGRMLLDSENESALMKTGQAFCLVAEVDEILARVTADGIAERPLLADQDPRSIISRLLTERADGYGRFEQIDTTGVPPHEVADRIIRLRGPRQATSIAEVVANGLCIGCGLCEAVTNHRVTMQLSGAGSKRPVPANQFTAEEELTLLAACPGTVAQARTDPAATVDEVWGGYLDMRLAWAGDPDVRFEAATGGLLTALGLHALESGLVHFVLHVGPDPQQPVRSRWVMSETAAEVRANTGSRYGPTAPLAGFVDALDRGEPFMVIAKPCDLGAVHAYAPTDARVDELCIARLAMVCGGQSKLEKSTDVLDGLGITETEVTLFRYRGYGNPGPTRIETADERSFEVTYNEMWDDQAGWKLESRCTFCPDALGEASDVAASDVWPGGGPTGEDAGFNGMIVRTAAGSELVTAAVSAGALVLGDPISPREFDDLQPHQVRKKIALTTRNEGLSRLGKPTITTDGLRVESLGTRLTGEVRQAELEGTIRRARDGRYSE